MTTDPEDTASGTRNNSQLEESTPRIGIIGVGGAGGNAINNMIRAELPGVNFLTANTDAQALAATLAPHSLQLGAGITRGLGSGANVESGRAAAEESVEDMREWVAQCNLLFIAAGMGGGTGTGAAPVIAKMIRDEKVLCVGVVTLPFDFEGPQRMRTAVAGLQELEQMVDTLIVIPNQNLFAVANASTTFADAFVMADEVLRDAVAGVTNLIVQPGLINLDFADIRSVITINGRAMMGTGEASGINRAMEAAEAAIANPLLDIVSIKGAQGLLINVTGGSDMTLFEIDAAANRIRREVDGDAVAIFGSTFNAALDGTLRVSVVATGLQGPLGYARRQRIPTPEPEQTVEPVPKQKTEVEMPRPIVPVMVAVIEAMSEEADKLDDLFIPASVDNDAENVPMEPILNEPKRRLNLFERVTGLLGDTPHEDDET
ncbi:MAG: cell division protein FtsZ [Rhodospirillales bacterium]|nr:cell division protein FtsZ [Rhodospirillales bacterium]